MRSKLTRWTTRLDAATACGARSSPTSPSAVCNVRNMREAVIPRLLVIACNGHGQGPGAISGPFALLTRDALAVPGVVSRVQVHNDSS